MDQATSKFQQIKKHQIMSRIFYINGIKLEDKTNSRNYKIFGDWKAHSWMNHGLLKKPREI